MPGAIATGGAANAVPGSQEFILEKPSKQMSKGEKIYNWTVYSGLNYWTNLGISLVIADYFTNLGGRKWLDRTIETTAKGLEKSGMFNPKQAHHHSKVALETLVLTSGGWILLAPLKVMEDHKRDIVHWTNDKLGVDQRAPDGHKETPDEIYIEKEQPHQSWVNVLKRRLIASVAVIGAGHIINAVGRNRDKTNEYKAAHPDAEDDPHGGKKNLEEFIVKTVNKGLTHVPGGQKVIDSPVAQRYIGFAALDTIFTKITAMTMYLTNGAKKAKMPNEISKEEDRPAHEMNNQITYDKPEEKTKSFVEAVQKEKAEQKAEEPKQKAEPAHKKILENTPSELAMSEKIAAQRNAAEPNHTLAS